MNVWKQEGDVLAPAATGDPDSVRAWEPWALEEDDGTLRMWYAAHDRTTGRILEAVLRPGGRWQRRGVAVDAGLAGESDRYGVGSPCVVRVNEGYLMAYTGFDGQESRLHLAVSDDGDHWISRGTVMQGEDEDSLEGGTPCLVVGGEQWWLYYSGHDRSANGRRSSILAAVSRSGDSWDRVGPVLQPEAGELAVSHPCVMEISRKMYMFYATEHGDQGSIALATSANGVDWTRRGIVLATPGDDPDSSAVSSPCIVRLRDGSLRMWYARRPWGDDQLAYSISAASFSGPGPGNVES